jgi:hypothetical protein
VPSNGKAAEARAARVFPAWLPEPILWGRTRKAPNDHAHQYILGSRALYEVPRGRSEYDRAAYPVAALRRGLLKTSLRIWIAVGSVQGDRCCEWGEENPCTPTYTASSDSPSTRLAAATKRGWCSEKADVPRVPVTQDFK